VRLCCSPEGGEGWHSPLNHILYFCFPHLWRVSEVAERNLMETSYFLEQNVHLAKWRFHR
jgi:hypothetical protein